MLQILKRQEAEMSKIQKHTDVIRYICENVANYPEEAWTKAQLIAMMVEIGQNADSINLHCGIVDLPSHYDRAWPKLSELRSTVWGDGLDAQYEPSSGPWANDRPRCQIHLIINR
jgi:hypothetical protein